MKIATIGTGNMARTLGGAWAHQGQEVFFGSREREKGEEAARIVENNTRGGTSEEGILWADIILYTPRVLPSEALTDTSLLSGKVLIDCGNRPMPDEQVFGPPPIPSFAEQLAEDVPGVRVVKAFNTIPQEVLFHPPEQILDRNFACFIAGDDAEAKGLVAESATGLGFEAIDCGPLSHAWMLESAADLLRYILFNGRGPNSTFSLPTLPTTEPKYGGRKYN